jgi:hypothetical protein
VSHCPKPVSQFSLVPFNAVLERFPPANRRTQVLIDLLDHVRRAMFDLAGHRDIDT